MRRVFKIVSLQFAFALAWFTLVRAAFLWVYFDLFQSHGLLAVGRSFLHGVRFDLSVIAVVYGTLNLALFMPFAFFRKRLFLSFVQWTGLVFLLALFYIQVVDLGYYEISGRRLGNELFALGNDVPEMVKTVLLDRPFESAGYVAGNFLLAWLWLKVWKRFVFKRRTSLLIPLGQEESLRFKLAMPVAGILFLLFGTVVARGGFQIKPLSISDAFDGPSLELGHLSLNAPFTSLVYLTEAKGKKYHFKSEREAVKTVRSMLQTEEKNYLDENYTFFRKTHSKPEGIRKRNVVLLIMESFTNYMMKGRPGSKENLLPFLTELSKKSLFFENFIASGTRSFEGMVSILYGLNANPDFFFIYSPYEQNFSVPLPAVYRQYGYQTSFVFGIFYNSFKMHNLAKRAGFANVVSKEDFVNHERRSDSSWGVWDGVALDRVLKEADRATKPFFVTFFSVTTHSPWEVPDDNPEYNRFTAQKDYWKNTFLYADGMLKKFFSEAQKKPWYEETLFLVTADHSYYKSDPSNKSQGDRLKIPLVVFDPSGELQPGRISTVSSQVDILPTLLDYHGFETWHNSMGKNLLANSPHHFAFHVAGKEIMLVTQEKAVLSNFDKPLQVFDFIKDPEMKNPIPFGEDAAGRELMDFHLSYLQESNNSIIDNRLAPRDYFLKLMEGVTGKEGEK